jgi:DNA gyrase subunit B
MTDQKIKKLSEYFHTRKKNEMYYGSRSLHTQLILTYKENKAEQVEMSWVPAVFTPFREIIDNALDEVVGHGYGNRIDIGYDELTREMYVEDNGRGIPITWDEEHQMHTATLALSEARSSRNFEERGNVAGTNGLGGAGTNFCSEYFTLTIHRDGKKFVQKFHEGNELLGEELIKSPPKITDIKTDKTGTRIDFKLSEQVFPDLSLPMQFVKDRAYEIAIANPDLKVYFNGTQIKIPHKVEQALFEKTKPITVEIEQDKFKTKFWISPGWITDGDHYHTVVNNIFAINGGVHVENFRRHFFGNLLRALEKESKKRKLSPNRSDITEGVLVYNVTSMFAPDFDSQSKTRLINESVSKIINKALDDEELFKDIIRKNREWIDAIYTRCAERTMKKDASDAEKQQRKNLRNKVADLMDANGKDRSKCIIFFAEGQCISSDTNILIKRGDTISHIKANDVKIGDEVLTHKNRFKQVEAISSKISETVEIKSSLGIERVSKSHKLLVFDTVNNDFIYLEAGKLEPSRHQLVKNKLVKYSEQEMVNIDENKILKNSTKFSRMIIDETGSTILSSDSHRFATFDNDLTSYEMKEALLLIPGKHRLIKK